ncbi:hypothetical protein [Subtercola sp. YIM 133946]|uniref:hypothetical protein n=1 Tax=Subtercola sp. YIM 133946 TaxID=3118909 RepID=UPI002F953FC4
MTEAAHPPGAQPQVRIEPAAAASWPAVEHAFTGGGDGAGCWCQWFVLPSREFSASGAAQLRGLLRQEVEGGHPLPADTAPAGHPPTPDTATAGHPLSPGLIAFVDGVAAGWVRVGPRAPLKRLMNSRVVKTGSPEPADDPDVWA